MHRPLSRHAASRVAFVLALACGWSAGCGDSQRGAEPRPEGAGGVTRSGARDPDEGRGVASGASDDSERDEADGATGGSGGASGAGSAPGGTAAQGGTGPETAGSAAPPDPEQPPPIAEPDEGAGDVAYQPVPAVEIDLSELVPTSGQHVVFSSGESGLFLLDLENKQLHDLNPTREPVAATMPSPDGKTLLFSAGDAARTGGVYLVRFAANGFVPARPVAGFEDIPAVHLARPATYEGARGWSPGNRFVALERGREAGALAIDVVDTWTAARHLTVGDRPELSELSFRFSGPGSADWFLYTLATARGQRDVYARLSAGGRSATVVLEPDQSLGGFSSNGRRLFFAEREGGALRAIARTLETGEDQLLDSTVAGEELLSLSVVEHHDEVLGLYRAPGGNRVLRSLRTDGVPGSALLSDLAKDVERFVTPLHSEPVLLFYADRAEVWATSTDGQATQLVLEGADAERVQTTMIPMPALVVGERIITVVEGDNSSLLPPPPQQQPRPLRTRVDVTPFGDQGPYDCGERNFSIHGWSGKGALLERGTGAMRTFDVTYDPQSFPPILPAHAGVFRCGTWSSRDFALAFIEDTGSQRFIHLADWSQADDLEGVLEVYSTAEPIRELELVHWHWDLR